MTENAETNDFVEIRIRRPMAGGISMAGTNLTLRLPVVRRGAGWAIVETAGGRVKLDTSGGREDITRVEWTLISNFAAKFAEAAAYSGDALVEAHRERQKGRGLARWSVGAHWQGRGGPVIIEAAAKLAVILGGQTYLPRWIILARARDLDGGGRGVGEHIVVPRGHWPGLDTAVSAWRSELDLDAIEAEATRLAEEQKAEGRRKHDQWIADAPQRAAEREAHLEEERVAEEAARARAKAREEKRRATQTDRVVEPAHVSGVNWVKNSYGSLVPQRWAIENCRVEFRRKKRIIITQDGKRRFSDLLGLNGEPADFDWHEARRID